MEVLNYLDGRARRCETLGYPPVRRPGGYLPEEASGFH